MKIQHLATLFCGILGVLLGVGAYTFLYARGFSYLTNDPAVCTNCHVMNEQFDGWVKSSHRAAATCNDCHTPPTLVGKYMTKAINGFWHSYAFTTGWFPDRIQIGPRNRAVTESACRNCHADIVEMIDGPAHPVSSKMAGRRNAMEQAARARAGSSLACLGCHRSVGHYHLD